MKGGEPEDFDPSTVEYEYKEKALKAFERLDEINDIKDLLDLEDMFIEWKCLVANAYTKYIKMYIPGRRYQSFKFELSEINERIRLLGKRYSKCKIT